MKRIIIVLLLLCSTLLFISCKPSVEPDEQISYPVGLLNEVKYRFDTNRNYQDQTYFDHLNQFSGFMYELMGEFSDDNYVVSPISVYMAFSLLYFLGDEEAKAEIEETFNLSSYEMTQAGQLFLKLVHQGIYEGQTMSVVDLSNSIWINEGTYTDEDILKELAEAYYCYASRTPFSSDIDFANQEIQEFIKSMTHGLIDRNFDLSPSTVFALINTLYFKDAWTEGYHLTVNKAEYQTGDKSVLKAFLTGKYIMGVEKANDRCSYFYVVTNDGYKLKFLVPNEGVTLDEVMSKDNIYAVNKDRDYYRNTDKEYHYTRCIFPSFNVDSYTEMGDIFLAKGMFNHIFTSYYCDLVKDEMFVSDIKHQAVVKVNDEGVEAAAVTIIANKCTSADPSMNIYHDFVVDQNFGFLLTTPDDIILFAGKIVEPESSYDLNTLDQIKLR